MLKISNYMPFILIMHIGLGLGDDTKPNMAASVSWFLDI